MGVNWIAILRGAVLTKLVFNLLFISLIFLLCFAASIFVTWLYRRRKGILPVNDGVRIGIITGLCASIPGFALSFLGLAGFQGSANEVEQIIPAGYIQGIGIIPVWGVLVFNLFAMFLTIIIGIFGGVIGWAIFRTER